MSALNSSVKKAFTLTELLVSLTVLGLIATLTLPHLFASFDRAKKRAVFKETYQALAEAVHAAMLEGEPLRAIVEKKLNPVKICRDPLADGCTTLHTNREAYSSAGVKLATGVSIFGFNDTYMRGSGSNDLLDGVIIGLEDFPKKEYYYIAYNVTERPENTSVWPDFPYDSSSTYNYLENMIRVNTIVRPGEIKCWEQACLDMLKKD